MKAREVMALAALLIAAHANAEKPLFPGRPEEGRFYLEKLAILETDDALEIDRIGAQVLKDKGYPVIIVVIQSRRIMQSGHLTIEQYAHLLFDEWGIGRQANNKGMLLLVSIDDREARIELGAGWNGQVDHEADAVMNNRIIPQFKSGDYSEGLVEGARGLRDIAYRNSTYGVPLYGSPGYSGNPASEPQVSFPGGTYSDVYSPPTFSLAPIFFIGFVVVLIIVINWITHGQVFNSRGYYRSGFYDDSYLWHHHHHHHSGGSYGGGTSGFGGGGGGSFGGGSGGGGGSTGRW